ncbi:hypothetical protein [Gaiella sp.]|uniref:hypothetical protein n=1 Tax=Gaiella sp. TaxID=2663207 RepID=UPI00326731E6
MRLFQGDYDPKAERRSANSDLETASREMQQIVEETERAKRELTRGEMVKFDSAEVRASQARLRLSEADSFIERNPLTHLILRAMVEGSGSGSYIVPDRYETNYWDRLRPLSVGLQSGFTVLETERSRARRHWRFPTPCSETRTPTNTSADRRTDDYTRATSVPDERGGRGCAPKTRQKIAEDIREGKIPAFRIGARGRWLIPFEAIERLGRGEAA